MDSVARVKAPFRSFAGASPARLSALIAGALLAALAIVLILQGVIIMNEIAGEESGSGLELLFGLGAAAVALGLLLTAWLLGRRGTPAGSGSLGRGFGLAGILIALAALMFGIVLLVGILASGAGYWISVGALYTIPALLLGAVVVVICCAVIAVLRASGRGPSGPISG